METREGLYLKWKSETRQFKELINNEKNPRKLSKADALQLQTSLEKFGVCEPIVINSNGEIIGGHQRVRTLKKMGHTEVEVYVPDSPLNQQEADELCIRLNKNTGSFDYDILANQWDLEDLIEWGFTQEELGLEQLPGTEEGEEREAPKKCTMNITFQRAEHLQEAENEIATIVDSYQGATYKVKIK